MHTLLALVVTVAASAVIARPPGPVTTMAPHEELAIRSPTRKYLRDYLLPRFLWPQYFAFDESLRESMQPMPPNTEWLTKEIERLSQMQMSYKPEIPRRLLHTPSYMKRWPHPYSMHEPVQPYYMNQPWPASNLVSEDMLQHDDESKRVDRELNIPPTRSLDEENKRKLFALTPLDRGYFDPAETDKPSVNLTSKVVEEGIQRGYHDGGRAAYRPELEPEPPRHTRQNPNLSRSKSFIADDLNDLRIGLHEDRGSLDSTRHVSAVADSPGSFYGIALLSAMCAAAALAILGFAFGWYTLSKRAKAAADVDYPAYGVTGPTVDTSGDRKLAHSAHMYHYQHQKQQIIAMERSGMEQRSGSVSDPESEEENEEGDYTVYECPGFATTGDMEVKNPLFNEEPTPATPGKCEVVKPQPKD